ncbi:glycosyltransferase [Algoriphagus formosus]|uniref:glycosyltransferase n=1 Tax=Algoriphagus formosus TaxID=2007308 RepID=UPI000C29573D|nr:glycosyltransferase [Algoriphagus formosus]
MKNKSLVLQILIPTYNRAKRLEKNVSLISEQILKYGLNDKVGIIVSDNCSPDDTWSKLLNLRDLYSEINLQIYRQNKNIKLEPNAVFTLKKASAPYIMYTGDDDYIDKSYLARLIEVIEKDSNFSCAISGHIGVAPGEINRNVRVMPFDEKVFKPSYKNTSYLSHFFSQMSALVFKREDLYETYIANDKLRNIYPWIYFGVFNALRGNTYFLANQKTQITDFEVKDWSYDELGLIEDIMKNFSILKFNNFLYKPYLQIGFCYYAMNRFEAAKSKGFIFFFKQLIRVEHMSLFTKLFVFSFSYYKSLRSKF